MHQEQRGRFACLHKLVGRLLNLPAGGVQSRPCSATCLQRIFRAQADGGNAESELTVLLLTWPPAPSLLGGRASLSPEHFCTRLHLLIGVKQTPGRQVPAIMCAETYRRPAS